MINNKIRVGIVGGSGYVGVELIRLLLSHPEVQLSLITSRGHTGKKVGEIHESLSGLTELVFSDDFNQISDLDCVFVSVPHTESMKIISEINKTNKLNARKLKIIDCGADFRLNKEAFSLLYKVPHHAPELLNEAVYGIPELFREKIKNANLVANPGCFAHCIALSLAPLAATGFICGDIKVSATTGSSGSGMQPSEKTHHPYRNDNMSAYQILSHRHTPEIEQVLANVSGKPSPKVYMVPQSGPFVRGIFSVSFVTISNSGFDVLSHYKNFFKSEFFVRIKDDTPRLNNVKASHFIDIGITQNKTEVVVIGAIDNLSRGAASTAIHNMNIIFGIKESTGLLSVPVFP